MWHSLVLRLGPDCHTRPGRAITGELLTVPARARCSRSDPWGLCDLLSVGGANGLEVLAEPKSDGDLLPNPVVMLTNSQAEKDIMRSYSLHANAYISKPVDFDASRRRRADRMPARFAS